MPTLVFVMITAEADHTIPPHLGFLPGDPLHQFQDSETILTFPLITDSLEVFLDVLISWFGLVFRHSNLGPSISSLVDWHVINVVACDNNDASDRRVPERLDSQIL